MFNKCLWALILFIVLYRVGYLLTAVKCLNNDSIIIGLSLGLCRNQICCPQLQVCLLCVYVCLCLRVCGYLLEDMLANDRLRLAGWLRS